MTSVTELQNFILSHQLSTGMVHPGVGDYVNGQPIYRVDPYFADLAVQGLLRSSAASQPVLDFTQAWLNWRLANTEPGGTIRRSWHYPDGSVARASERSDGDDSAAALTPTTAWDFFQFGGSDAFFHQSGVKDKLELIASVNVNLQQPDGLTFGAPDYPVKYVADNAEVYVGYLAMANIERVIYQDLTAAEFYADRALRVQAGILNTLYNATTGYFGISLETNGNVNEPNWESWYDNAGAWSVVWPALFGVIPGDSVIARAQQAKLNLEFSGPTDDWRERLDFAGNGLAALTAGDATSALRHYEVVGSSPFPDPSKYPEQLANIADAGFLLRSADPYAANDQAEVLAGSFANIHVTANDADMFGLSDNLVVTTSPRALHGALTVLPGGWIRYQPDSGYSGSDSFQYTALNALGQTAVATVRINPPPALRPKVLPDVDVGVGMSNRVADYDFDDPYFNFQVTAGSLPPGISLARNGRLEGSSSAPGLYTFTVSATNTDLLSQSFTSSIRVLPPPTVVAASFLPLGSLTYGTTTLTVTFSEPVVGANLPANYRLVRAGLDGVWGTADDVNVPITSATPAGNVVTLSFGALIGGTYRLTVEDAIVDTAGLALDGDANSVAGGDWVRDFTVQATTLTPLAFVPFPAGVRFALTQALAVTTGLNLYDYRDPSGVFVLGASDVQLTNGGGQSVPGSLVVDATGTQFSFVATAGRLPADTYTLTLRSGANGFRTAQGDVLDGNGDGITGDNFTTTFTIAAPPANAVTVSLPHFARGPEQAVNVPTTSALGLPIKVSDGANLTAIQFEMAYDVGLLSVTNVTQVGGGTATLTPLSAGRTRVALTFSTPLSAGPQTVAYLTAAVPPIAATRYGERGLLDISNIVLTAQGGGSVPGIDQDAVQINTYFGDVGRNGRYDSFDVQQTSRLALDLDTGFQQHPLADPVLLADFNDNGRIDSFDTQRVSRLALNLPVTEAADLPNPLPTVTDTDRVTAPDPAKLTALRSDVDANGSVDAQDVLWAVYYFGESSNGALSTAIDLKRLDVNTDGLFDAADILLMVTDFDSQPANAEGESTALAGDISEQDELDALAYVLATDLTNGKKKQPS